MTDAKSNGVKVNDSGHNVYFILGFETVASPQKTRTT